MAVHPLVLLDEYAIFFIFVQNVCIVSKFLIVGLGNIGVEYANTRHNMGFMVLDAIAKENNLKFTPDRLADIAEYKFKGRILVLAKPSTYMNLSGKAVNYWLQAEKISLENLLVIADDLALPLGVLRLKGKGSDGGHNGLKNIQETLNSQNYSRLRFGVGNEFSKGKQVDYVLGTWSEEELKNLEPRIKLAMEMIRGFASIGLQALQFPPAGLCIDAAAIHQRCAARAGRGLNIFERGVNGRGPNIFSGARVSSVKCLLALLIIQVENFSTGDHR